MSDNTAEATPPPTMAEPQDLQTQPTEPQQESTNPEKANFSFTIWPPSKKTRDAVIARLIETLSTPSILSKRYGTLSYDEASATARIVEEEAFSASDLQADDDEDGINTLQLYSKEISKRMLDAVKSKAASASDSVAVDGTSQAPVISPAVTSEETPSVEAESS